MGLEFDTLDKLPDFANAVTFHKHASPTSVCTGLERVTQIPLIHEITASLQGGNPVSTTEPMIIASLCIYSNSNDLFCICFAGAS